MTDETVIHVLKNSTIFGPFCVYSLVVILLYHAVGELHSAVGLFLLWADGLEFHYLSVGLDVFKMHFQDQDNTIRVILVHSVQ